jgi:Ca2+/H+ antiporter
VAGGVLGAFAATLFLLLVVLTFYHDHLPHWLGMLVLKVWGMCGVITLIVAGLYRKGWRAFEQAFAGVMAALLLWSMMMALLFPPMMQMRGEAPRQMLITGSAFFDFFRNAGAETMLYSFAYVPLLALVWTGINMMGRYWVWRGQKT